MSAGNSDEMVRPGLGQGFSRFSGANPAWGNNPQQQTAGPIPPAHLQQGGILGPMGQPQWGSFMGGPQMDFPQMGQFPSPMQGMMPQMQPQDSGRQPLWKTAGLQRDRFLGQPYPTQPQMQPQGDLAAPPAMPAAAQAAALGYGGRPNPASPLSGGVGTGVTPKVAQPTTQPVPLAQGQKQAINPAYTGRPKVFDPTMVRR